MGARYIVGIDLGTTNSAVCYVDTTSDERAVQELTITQVVAAGEVDKKKTLPSFLLLPEPHEVATDAIALPWDSAPDGVVGWFAKTRGEELAQRLVSSAKSWLSHTGVDRQKEILPWRGSDEEAAGRRVSPVDAEARYLAHIAKAWEHEMGAPLAEQDVLLTVPASFDAVARELTVEAAKRAGIDVTLLEEPQAAFYAWLGQQGDAWRNELKAGDTALVFDLGGGTSDFSLISVIDDGGTLAFERVAVGDHILLGGDNMDLALAQLAMQKLGDKGKKLSASQYRGLVQACQRAKESLLAADGPDSVTVSVLGGGSKVIGGSKKCTIEKIEAQKLLIDGFFPRVELDDKPKTRRALGLRELGLPYATDAAVTRHLTSFLTRHGATPNVVLFNGGVMKGSLLQQRISQMLSEWYPDADVRALSGTDLDLAVARGAAYYGLVRTGKGIRIRGGTARAYYIGIESAAPAIPGFEPPVKALCVAPFGMEEGASEKLEVEDLGLLVGEPTAFRFFASSTRKEDVVGAVVDPEEADLAELPALEANLPATAGETDLVAVDLTAHVTEVGTLEVWGKARDGSGQWKLEYSVREQ